MKVLLVSHTCMSRTAGQPKLHALAAHDDITLTALVPDRMCPYGQWQSAEPPENPPFRFVVGRARWQNLLNQWYLLHYPHDLARVLRETQPDVVNIWEEPWSLTCAQVIHLTRRLCSQAKIIVETEQNIFKRLPPPFQQFQDYSLRHADLLVARNQEAVAVLRRKGFQGPVHVVPNGVDCDLFRPLPPAERQAHRRRLGWGNAETFLAGYVGRLVAEKGLADAVEALALLPEGVSLVFVGDGPFRGALETQAYRLRVEARIQFTGSLPLTELPAAMNALDALILPSRTTGRWKEQFGRVLIEAGACEVAVVGSDSGAIPEVVGSSGLIFPEGDIRALSHCLQNLRNDPERRAWHGAAGCERARTLFSWRHVAHQMHSLYRDLTSDEAGSRPRRPDPPMVARKT